MLTMVQERRIALGMAFPGRHLADRKARGPHRRAADGVVLMRDDQPLPPAGPPEERHLPPEDCPAQPTRRLVATGLGSALIGAVTPAWPWARGAPAHTGGQPAEQRSVLAQFEIGRASCRERV